MGFNFRIEEISGGWIDAFMSNGEGRVIISASYYLDNDSPRLLLEELLRLSSEESGKAYLLWNDEPGGYLWRLAKKGDILSYEIGECSGGEDEIEALPFSGEELSSCSMAEIFLKGKLPFSEFAGAIVRGMLPFSAGKERERYEDEWDMPFPEEAFSRLLELFPVKNITLN